MRKTIYLLFTLTTFSCSAQSLSEIYQEGLKAYEEKNYEGFKEKMFTIDTMRPNYPAVVYNLAGGYALTGELAKAIETLEKYILMDATQDFSEDADFASLLDLENFKTIKKKQNSLSETIEIEQTYSILLQESHPESMAYSKKQKTFFIGGVRDGTIWEVKEGREPKLWAGSAKNSWSIMGLQVSSDEKTLWACTSSMNNFQEYNQSEEGFASVLKYDIKNGKLLETYALPGGHNFGDLITDKAGNIFISDGTANKLYWISNKKGELVEFADLSREVFNLQGLTFDDSEEYLYLSDYIDGIYKIDIKTKNLEKLKIEAEDVLIKGIDGLYFTDNSLIALHNGTNPNRVVKYTLSVDQRAIIGKEVLAQGGVLGEPTQGVWLEGQLHFIMNSPWGAYDRDGNFNPEGESVIIGVIE
ncbi:hypothetical protein [Ekhidna sp.]|uniref:TPR end-of-group domain-containing protein n=1 Tax=Ekhidna sp. TaxID=2608089 RepID=UPI0032EF4194